MCTFCFVLCFISLGPHSREQTAVFSQVQKRSPGNSWKLGPETNGAVWTDDHRSNRLRLPYESTQLLQMDDVLTEPRTQGWICLLMDNIFRKINLLLPCLRLLSDAGNDLSCCDGCRQKDTITAGKGSTDACVSKLKKPESLVVEAPISLTSSTTELSFSCFNRWEPANYSCWLMHSEPSVGCRYFIAEINSGLKCGSCFHFMLFHSAP